MSEPLRKLSVPMVALLGCAYTLVGIGFAVPATHFQAWRWAAWVVSAAGFAAHIAYERFRLKNAPCSAALHVASAVALGTFGLAVSANIHSASTGQTDQHRQLLLLALVIWPVITALPAFLVAWVANVVLARAFKTMDGDHPE